MAVLSKARSVLGIGGQRLGPRSPSDTAFSVLSAFQRRSLAEQILLPAIPGAAAGYVASKVGHGVSLGLGIAGLLFLYASYRGYIRYTEPLREKVVSAFAKLEDKAEQLDEELKEIAGDDENIRESKNPALAFASDHIYIFGGFAAGLLVGYGLS